MAQRPDHRVPSSRLRVEAWLRYRESLLSESKRLHGGEEAAFRAGFAAGLLNAEAVQAKLKIHETMQIELLRATARLIEQRAALKDLRRRLERIITIAGNDKTKDDI